MTGSPNTHAWNEELAAEAFSHWLSRRVIASARGEDKDELDVDPSGRFWLGRLSTEESVAKNGRGEWGERLDPCQVGLRVRPAGNAPWSFTASASMTCWAKRDERWFKLPRATVSVPVVVNGTERDGVTVGTEQLSGALASMLGEPGLSGEIRVEIERLPNRPLELVITLVNTSPEKLRPEDKKTSGWTAFDTNLYEVELQIAGLDTDPFYLESLPDSFRYDRRVHAYGINCAVEAIGSSIRTVDFSEVERLRPNYWTSDDRMPDLTFATLSADPLPALQTLADSFDRWLARKWNDQALQQRAVEGEWDEPTLLEAKRAAEEAREEHARVSQGLEVLRSDPMLLRAFSLMNDAMTHAARGRYEGWRPFQVGFILANLGNFLVEPSVDDPAEILWFPTGGGKTETYLGLLVTAALFERLRGREAGVTAWTRFPLRMLSLQQTQRFADALAGAEIVRRREGIKGATLSMGFFIGGSSTPNKIELDPRSSEAADPDDEHMPARFRVLLRCPFCHNESIEMAFNRRHWKLEHRCTWADCPWPDEALPFYVVDEEIYRFLPTLVAGTLDKAALIAFQGSARGFFGPPLGVCSSPGHGYAYARRKPRPQGCLVPGCTALVEALEEDDSWFGCTFRLQDELHLLRDSLGAVDAHYEAALDHLQTELTGRAPRVIASSATLAGYEKQTQVLYRREGRAFPLQGPSADESFWSGPTPSVMRRYVAVAPRGVTPDFATDRILSELQGAIRELVADPEKICDAAGVPSEYAAHLANIYGVDVVYGNTLRDIEAAVRSFETQIEGGAPNTAELTGKTPFNEVRETLHRLDHPEGAFEDRIHVVAASSMMSHGVDIDRLNVMVMLGVPLATAEFIQATARVGRRWPGVVFVLHRIGRERDAGVYRTFPEFIRHGDRFIEPIPVTKRSRRVLQLTLPGLIFARVQGIHEPRSGQSLTTADRFRAFVNDGGMSEGEEAAVIESMLRMDEHDGPLRETMNEWLGGLFRNIGDPTGGYKWPTDFSPSGPPMRSLRDVEQSAPIRSVDPAHPVRADRSRSQILFGFLPNQTVDLARGVWKVEDWREPESRNVDVDTLRRALVRAVSPWVATGNDGGFGDEIFRARDIQVVSLSAEGGVKVGVFPNTWFCARCGRVGTSSESQCKCGARTWRQFHFVGTHDCGAIREPYAPKCKTHRDVAVRFPGTASAREIRFYCPVCNATLRMGLGFLKCQCGGGTFQWNVHRASSVYTPRTLVLVNPANPQRLAKLVAAGGPPRALEWVLGGMEEDTPGETKVNRALLIQQLIGSGLSPELAEQMADQAVASGELQEPKARSEPTLDDTIRVPAEHEAADIAMALSGGRQTLQNGVTRGSTARAVPLGDVGLHAVELVESFPILTAAFGFSRGDATPGRTRLSPFRNYRGHPRLYAEVGETEALFVRLAPRAVVRWLNDLGFETGAANDDRQAREALIRVGNFPGPTDDIDPFSHPGAALFTLVHSFAHRVIRRLAVFAGIERNSLSEYLVPRHAGFFIYAALRGDFVLGGLQAVFESELPELVKDLLIGEHRCPLDPGCTTTGAACHACLHVGEPSCRMFNRFLDRRTLFGKTGYMTSRT